MSLSQQAESPGSEHMDQGIVYILSNPSMPNTYKIGLTRRTVEERICSLRSTSIPSDFVCIREIKSDHALQLEKFIHRKIKTNRISASREFFSFSSDEMVVSSVESIAARFLPRSYTEKEAARLKTEAMGSTPSQQAKASGLKSLTQVSDLTGVSLQTLTNWHKNKPELFKIVLLGCLAT
jgi:hypothetical protein